MLNGLLRINYTNLDAFFFDFDGVIVDSVPIKTRAFQEIMGRYGAEVVAVMTRYHLEHGGIDRYTKIRYTLDSCGIAYDEALIDSLAAEFAGLVKQQVCDAPLLPGIAELLEELRRHGVRTFVVTGTPEEEMRSIIATKGLDGFFLETSGSPRKKAAILSDLTSRYCIDLCRALYIGDSRTDFEAAKSLGILFLGV